MRKLIIKEGKNTGRGRQETDEDQGSATPTADDEDVWILSAEEEMKAEALSQEIGKIFQKEKKGQRRNQQAGGDWRKSEHTQKRTERWIGAAQTPQND